MMFSEKLAGSSRNIVPPRLFRPTASYDRPIRSLLFVHRGESPTLDIYLTSRLRDDFVPVRTLDLNDPEAVAAEGFPDGTFIVVVRYLSAPLARSIRAASGRLAGVAYLLDDDIPGALADPTLPRPYAWKLAIFYWRHRRHLERIVSEIWLSSPGLMERYGGPGVQFVPPLYFTPQSVPEEQAVKVFYHAEVSHRQEAVWLRDVVHAVQERNPRTVFEIFGRQDVKRVFRGIPRCRIVHPMSWSAYLPYSSAISYDIGLAPLRPGLFNGARSFNKLYDITRCGAAGIYAARRPYDEVITDGVHGLLRGDDPAAWVEAICDLAEDPERRRGLFREAHDLCERLRREREDDPLFSRFRKPDVR